MTMAEGGRAVRLLDAALVVWVGVWIWLGLAIGHEVSNLTTLSDTVVTSGQAVQQTGQALRRLEGLPFGIGDRIASIDRQIDQAGRAAVASGQQSRDSVEHLAVLLTISVAVIPSVPVLAMYVPFRVSRLRDVRTVRRAARRAASDPAFEEFLARRAAENLPYHRLREISPNPWRDLEEGRFDQLARAELSRLGLGRLARRLAHRPRPDERPAPRAATR